MPDRHLDHVCSAFFYFYDMKEIQLSKQGKNKGMTALVDDEDFEYLSQFRWYADIQRGSHYAMRWARLENGKYSNNLMHRELVKCGNGLIIDHIDGNGLNNQKSNLRTCTHSQNLRNTKPKRHGNSKYKGVSWNKSHGVFVAKILINGKNTYIKQSQNEIEVAKAYDKKAKEIFGEFAWLNFP